MFKPPINTLLTIPMRLFLYGSHLPFLSAMYVIADTLKEKLRASGSNMRAHVVHALYSSFFFCNTPVIWLCMKAVAKNLGCVLLLDSE